MKKIYLIFMLLFAFTLVGNAQGTDDITQLTKKAEAGNAESQRLLALQLIEAKDPINGIKWIKKASANGDAEAQFIVGKFLCEGLPGFFNKNMTEAMNLWKKSADKGNYLAACYYGLVKLSGEHNITKNVAEGVRYLRIAADHKDKTAITTLVGDYCNAMYNQTNYGVKRYLSYNDFVKYLKMGAELGDEDLQAIYNNLPKLQVAIEQEKSLVAKYGQKAFDSIKKGKVYIGMPEGFLTEYKTLEDDGTRYQMYKYNGPSRDKVGTYKQYIPNAGLQMANILGKVFPRIVKVRNGKVTNVVY